MQVARVDASHIIHGGNPNGTGSTAVDRDRRTFIQNTVDIERAYLLDVFEIVGGETHDFLVRGSEMVQQAAPHSDLALAAVAVPLPQEREATFHGTRGAPYAADQAFWVEFNFADRPAFGSRTHVPAGEAGELFLSRITEQWTDAGSPGVPHLLLHRAGPAPLTSTFVAVHEVLDGSGESFVRSVTRQPIGDAAVGVTVTLTDGRVDTYLVSFDGPQAMQLGDVSAEATVAASVAQGERGDLWLVGGDRVEHGGRILESPAVEHTGEVLQVNRLDDGASANAFETDLDLPLGRSLAGQALLLEHFDGDALVFVDSYIIDRVDRACGRTRVHVRTDPGVRLGPDGTEEIHHNASVRLRLAD